MKIVFMGTPEFAVPSLKILADNGYNIAAVVTQPDRPGGRGEKICFSPVKVFSISRNIRVLQYERIRTEGIDDIKNISPDLIVTAAYGQILPQELIDIPKYGIVNVHASLLPKYRGAAPIQWAVINGETETGVTIMKTRLALDSGEILLQKKIGIGEKETAGELFVRIAELGAEALLEGVKAIQDGTAVFYEQDEVAATYFSTIKKEDARISFEKSAKEIVNFVRGMSPNPGAFTYINGDRVKVFLAEVEDIDVNDSKVGEIIVADAKRGLIIAVKGGAVRLREIQFPNGKRMTDTAYLTGHGLL
ncbi:MAG: methionyl-tRNA formyltransferase [Clostridiales bacterium]|jgi:methionyl-tRNA formyltransferase|nr:methionyl-tRNA formyltransferase [Clostridiales bacterium]